MRLALLFGLVSIFAISGCGKKEEAPPATQPAETKEAPAEDTASQPEPDTAAAEDTAAAAEDTAAAAEDTAAAGEDTAAAAGDGGDATATAAVEPRAPDKPFDDLTEKEKKEHMKKVVIPVMRPRFQKFDPEEFGPVKCTVCHGPGAKEGDFEMPNEDLPKLPATQEGWAKLSEEEPEALEFMKEEIVPAMAIMLGEKPRSAENPDGFGCFGCHAQEAPAK